MNHTKAMLTDILLHLRKRAERGDPVWRELAAREEAAYCRVRQLCGGVTQRFGGLIPAAPVSRLPKTRRHPLTPTPVQQLCTNVQSCGQKRFFSYTGRGAFSFWR